MFKLAIISSLVLLSSFNVYAQEKEQIEVWEEPSKSFAITKAIADFEAINDCEIKLREISSAKQLDVLKEHIKIVNEFLMRWSPSLTNLDKHKKIIC